MIGFACWLLARFIFYSFWEPELASRIWILFMAHLDFFEEDNDNATQQFFINVKLNSIQPLAFSNFQSLVKYSGL